MILTPRWRKQKHPTEWDWGQRRGKAWSDDDEACARFLRHCGMSDDDIGKILDRPAQSIRGKLGYTRRRKYAVTYRPPQRQADWGQRR